MMPSRRSVVTGLAVALVSLPALAEKKEQTAEEFLRSIYDQYKGKDAKGVPLGSAATINRYFEPSLARIMIADSNAAAKRGEVGTLEADPFVNAQDFEVGPVTIDVKPAGTDKAIGTAKFKNLGSDMTIVFNLVKTKLGWRIEDILTDGASMRAMFKKR